jgi:cytochrome c oxidase assembly protein subunit 15
MTTPHKPLLHRFAVFVFLWTILLFVAGALVTSKDAALSVPDWPKTFGTWFPSLRQLVGGSFFEHSHRVIAGVLGILLVLEAVAIWLLEERRWLRWFALAAVGGVVGQAILGGQVVIRLLHYWLPVLHACFAQIMFAAVLGMAVFTSKWWIDSRPALEDKGAPAIHTLVILNAAITFVQVFLGAGFRHGDMPIWPHMAGSLVVLGATVWTAAALRRRFDESRELVFGRILLHSMVGTQILLGIAAYWSRLSTADAPQPMPVTIWLTVIHTVFGALLFASSVLLVFLCYRLVPRRGSVTVASERRAAV